MRYMNPSKMLRVQIHIAIRFFHNKQYDLGKKLRPRTSNGQRESFNNRESLKDRRL